MITSLEFERAVGRRADALFAEQRHSLHAQTDRLFAILMVAQWLFGIAAAAWISPRTWDGATSSIHLHVWTAVLLGGALTAFPVALALLRPGALATRLTIGIAQMLTSALLIHLTGGRIETHFHVFGSLAFLAIYRDWRVLIPATIVVTADHILRGALWPQSVYGVLTASHWRWLEHAGWVVFEDIVLIHACLRGSSEMREIARRTAQLEMSEERYREIFDGNLSGNFIINPQGSVLACNEAFAQILGLGSAPQALASNVAVTYTDPAMRDRFVERVRVERRVLDHETALRRPDGTHVDVIENVVGGFDENGELIELRGFLRDVTERKRLDAELAEARDAALQSARVKSEFLANMSHEIRTPMNGVLGMAGLLLDTKLTAGQREHAQTITSSAESLLAILNDILDLSKMDASKLAFEVIDFDLGEAVEGVLDLLGTRAHSQRTELMANIRQQVPLSLKGDPGRLRQVLTNLVSNALKFTEGGEVVVQVDLEEDRGSDVVLRFEVSDTGIGIPPDVASRLFEPFTQADGSTTRKYGGTGLGLSISKRLVEMMGGEIGIASDRAFGALFWFTAAFPKGCATVTVPGPIGGQHVGLVDADETSRTILSEQIEGWGAAVEIIDGVTESLEALVDNAISGRYSTVIIHHEPERRNGIALARRIRSVAPAIRIVVLLPVAAHSERELLTADGIDSVSKPVKHTALRAAVEGRHPVVRRADSADAPVLGRSRHQAAVRILIVEDNVVNQQVALQQLRRLGYTADIVSNGKEAIDAVARVDYPVILMDCQMPELDGYEATRCIRQMDGAPRRRTIIAMTANALGGDQQKCLEAGMDDYITKPVDKEILARVLDRWCSEERPQRHTDVMATASVT